MDLTIKMMKMKKTFILPLLALVCILGGCAEKGDNSDYDFGDDFDNVATDVYKYGYGRIEGSVRLVTYNVHRCTPPNDNVNADYDGIGKAIGLMDADVVALQELDRNTSRHPFHQLEELASRAGMDYLYCKTINSGSGEYGIGIMYRKGMKVLNSSSHTLPGDEPRKFLVTEFENMVFIATHFCHKSVENRSESVRLIEEYIDENLKDCTKPVFLAGDLNAESSSEEIQLLYRNWTSLGINTGTYFNTSYPKRIDYVLVWNGNGADVEVIGTAVPYYEGVDFRLLSDHYPVLVDLKEF